MLDPRDRDRVAGDLQDGYITPQKARDVYGLSDAEVRRALES